MSISATMAGWQRRNHSIAVGLIVLVVAWGGYLRFYRLGEMSLWMDEAFSVQTARAIQQQGVPRLETGEISWSWLPMHYVMAASLAAFDDMQVGARVPSALAGAAVAVLASLLAYLLTQSWLAAVWTAFFVAFSVPDIAWSRQARGYALLQMLGLAALSLAMLAARRRSLRWGFWACIPLVFAILTHRAGYVYWLMCAGIVVMEVAAHWRRTSRAPARSEILVLAGLAGLPLLAGALLPGDSSQGLAETVSSLELQTAKPSYAIQYLSLIFDFWSWNVLWMAGGILLLAFAEWRKAIPIMVGVAAYLFVLSEKNLWFHVRYLMPIIPLLHVAVAVAMAGAFGWLRAKNVSVAKKTAGTGVVLVLCLVTTADQNLTFAPEAEYELGPTEPQADWKGAFRWIQSQAPEPATVMTLPVFHDLYLGPHRGKKFFLPFTMTRVPGDWKEAASYAVAKPVMDKKMLQRLDGFVVLDAFSFYSLKDRGIQEFLSRIQPTYATPDGSVQIWRLDAAQSVSRQDAFR